LHSCGLFLSIPESKQNLSEKEKFRVSEEITPSKLGFVKMMGEDKNQPWLRNAFFVLRFCFKDKNEGPSDRGNISNSNAKFLLVHQIFNVSRKYELSQGNPLLCLSYAKAMPT
jgi:hypothetical protein